MIILPRPPQSKISGYAPARGHVFRVVVGSQIVVPPTIPPSQWYSRDSNSWPWLWYHLSDCELCHSTSKSISDEESTLKSFMAFDIISRRPVFRVVIESQIVIPNRFNYNINLNIVRKLLKKVFPLIYKPLSI